uniref:RNA replicase n=1 Tax=Hubei noda-like virus 10 TaxID=1922966 RepID=A0A1L3KF88_9VIRU|nr:hypothetical protein [Hubei noda-like virus 10]
MIYEIVVQAVNLPLQYPRSSAVVVGVVTGFAYRWLTTKKTQAQLSKDLELCSNRTIRMRDLMIDFSKTFTKFAASPVHSHGQSAASRSAANTFMHELATQSGFDPYSVSKSATDACGSRLFYFLKDTTMKFQLDEITANSVLIFTDVDYYADLNRWMEHGLPMLMYTFCPTTMAGKTSEYSWRFVGDECEYTVSGGSSYRHQLWDFKGDVCSVVDRNTLDLIVFNVEQRKVPGDENHRFVYLTPANRIKPTTSEFWNSVYQKMCVVANGLGWNLDFLPTVYQFLQQERLERRTFGSGRYLYDPLTDVMSVASDGSHHSVEVPARVYAAIQQRLENKDAPPTVGDVERMLTVSQVPDPSITAPLLFNHMSCDVRANVIPTKAVAANFDPLGEFATTDARNVGVAASSPLASEPALFATKSRNADVSSIKGRVTRPTNTVIPSQQYARFAAEFIAAAVDQPGSGVPIDFSDVREAQSKPAQRARYDLDEWLLSVELPNELKCFIKAEPYANPNDPRNITTMNTNCNVQVSAYTLAMKHALLKRCHWYGPGKTPTETVAALASITRNGAIGSDFSRFDGSVSEWLQRNVMLAFYMKWIHPDYRAHLKKAFMLVFSQTARTQTGLRFSPGWGTRSGSPPTTDGNTIVNAFVSYCVLRQLGFSVEAAYAALGVYCGDDGLVPNMPGYHRMLEAVCKDLGLSVKAETFLTGPYPYLGRYFVDPGTTVNSFQDPLRTIPKLHVVQALGGVSLEQLLTNKASGYAVTDYNTPIIGTWARAVMRITRLDPRGLSGEERFKHSQCWPYSARDHQLMVDAMASVMGVSSSELARLDELLLPVDDLDSFPVILETEWTPKIPALVGNLVIGQVSGQPSAAPKAPRAKAAKKSNGPKPAGNDRPADGKSAKTRRRNQASGKRGPKPRPQ